MGRRSLPSNNGLRLLSHMLPPCPPPLPSGCQLPAITIGEAEKGWHERREKHSEGGRESEKGKGGEREAC